MAIFPHVHTTNNDPRRTTDHPAIRRNSYPSGRRRHPTTGYVPIYNRDGVSTIRRRTSRARDPQTNIRLHIPCSVDPRATPPRIHTNKQRSGQLRIIRHDHPASIPCGDTPSCTRSGQPAHAVDPIRRDAVLVNRINEFQTSSSSSFEFEFELARTFLDLIKSISVE